MKIAVIMRAVPGSGKSTFAYRLKKEAESRGLTCSIHSSDQKFMVNGEYKFNPELLFKYHSMNMREFSDAMSSTDIVIADNTNIKRRDYIKYVDLARAQGYKVVSVAFPPMSIEEHVKRNVHSVPEDAIVKMVTGFNKDTDGVDEQYSMPCTEGAHESPYADSLIQAILA